jgi:gamma-glutamyltranspeptidase / glutathione hydrolase
MIALAPFTTRYAPTAMVCSVDQLASNAGLAMLRAGGSAADAAIAANAVLAVTNQHQCGLGGDLFALVHAPGHAEPACLNASGRAGSGADPERLRAEGHVEMPRFGDVRAVPVPGCVDGWVALHERFGRLPLAEVLEPSRRYAADGFPASPTLVRAVSQVAGLAEAADYADAREPGSRVRRPGVARVLAAIAERGRAGFYEGEFGAGLIALGGGEYVDHDLLRPLADWVEPLGLDAWGRRLWTAPPNSQGYLTLASSWLLGGVELPDPDDGRWAGLLVEAARRARADRDDVLWEGADGAGLLAPERLASLRAQEVVPARADGEDTTFLCAVDGEGMGVSLIQSNFDGWGSLLVVPGVRIFLQNRGSGFSLAPGHPAEYGPGRRPPHTLSPMLLTSGGDLDAVLGTMGGHAQPQILLQLLARRYAAGQDPARAVAAPRWRLGRDSSVEIEGGAPRAWADALEARGEQVSHLPAWALEFGLAHTISVEEGRLAGAWDPRGLSGAAAGF